MLMESLLSGNEQKENFPLINNLVYQAVHVTCKLRPLELFYIVGRARSTIYNAMFTH